MASRRGLLRRSSELTRARRIATLEAARDNKSPIILQTSQGGSVFFAGKGLPNSADKQEAAVAGAIAAAHFIRSIAPVYGIPVILHTDHCKCRHRFTNRWYAFDANSK